MVGYKIIRAGVDDVMLIHDMAQVVFRHTYKDILSPEQVEYMMHWMYSPDNLRVQMEEGHVFYIALDNAVPCGYLSIQPEGTSESGRYRYHLQKIYILPTHQGAGLGRILFETALSHVRSESSGSPATLELNVNRNNPSIGFYKHLGLKILKQGDFDIGGGYYMNDYIMGIDV